MVYNVPRLQSLTAIVTGLFSAQVIAPYRDRFEMEVVNIDDETNVRWKNLYRFEIPVFHFENEFLMKNYADPELLRLKLDNFNTQGRLQR